MRRALVWGMLAFVWLSQVAAAQESESDDDNVLASIKPRVRGEYLIVPVTIKGVPLPFVVDTGCRCVFVEYEYRQLFGEATTAEMIEPSAANTPTATTTASTASKSSEPKPATTTVRIHHVTAFAMPQLRIGSLSFRPQTQAMCHDLFAYSVFSEKTVCGVLGAEALKKCVLRIDVDTGETSFLRKAVLGAHAVTEKIRWSSDGLPTVLCRIPGINSTSFVVNTALRPGCVQITQELFRSLNAQKALTTYDPIIARYLMSTDDHPVTLEKKVMLARLAEFEWAGNVLHDVPVMVGPSNAIGTDLLRGFIATFDFPNSTLSLEPNGRAAPTPLRVNSATIQLLRHQGLTVVQGLFDRTLPAERCLELGDVITHVDGSPAEEFTLLEIRERFNTGRPLTLSVSHEAESHDIVLEDSDWLPTPLTTYERRVRIATKELTLDE